MIVIDMNYHIEADSNQWVLHYNNAKIVKDKEVNQSNKWYCSSLKNALNRYCDESLKTSKNIEDILQKLDQLNKTISNINQLTK